LSATESLCKEFDHQFLHKISLKELDQFLAAEENKNSTLSLLLISQDSLDLLTPEALLKIQILYQTNLILTAFEDPLKPLKKTETWPVENIIYKPFDLAILQEHIRFAFIRSEKVKTNSVHSSKEKNQIEKIRRHHLIQLSEFGFTIQTPSSYNLNEAYKFYHLSFVDQKKSSLWAKAVSKNDTTYEFIFCNPTLTVTTKIRQLANESKVKIKNAKWAGSEKNKTISTPHIYLQMNETDDFEKLKDYFQRKFTKAVVHNLQLANLKEKLTCDLFISETEYTADQLQTFFKIQPLYFRISNDTFKNRAEAEKILNTETLRLQKPIDRNYLGRMVNSFFPACAESDANPANWFLSTDPALYSEMIEVTELSEAAFVYSRDSLLKRGDFQEFALPQDDENELRPIKAKIQFADFMPDAERKYSHQVVFYGIRDDMLKKLRLWMLQNHIDQKKSGA
jgi:hypothetical protein